MIKKIISLGFLLFFAQYTCALTLNFSSISVRELLKLLGQYSQQNLIISDAINGDITLSLTQVSWKQALKAILLSQNLKQEKSGTVTLIKPGAQKRSDKTGAASVNELRLVQLNYAKADEIKQLLQPQLTEAEKVSIDKRENAVLLRADKEHIKRLVGLVKHLDKPVPQVLIATQVVTIDSNYEHELGVRFGLTSGHHLSGTLKGANELAAGKSPAEVKPSQRLNVDLPVTTPGAGHLGLALLKLTGGTLLDLELSALEAEGHAQLISSPELIAANQQTAEIQSGQEIPYQEKAGEGSTSVTFKKAVLSLQVKPQIIPDNKILLHLKVTQDKPGAKEVLGVPTVDTRQVSTNILLKNGETVVLGGIYEQSQTNHIERVPFMASLPIIGRLFRYRKISNNKQELLIFVTPKIIKE